MLLLICNWFPVLDSHGIPTGREELLVDYAVNPETGMNVCVPNQHPSTLGGKWDNDIGEWVIG